jgi:branched-chain amino acid transport system permease protein
MDLKQSYFEDIRLWRRPSTLFWSIGLVVFLALLPYLVKSYYLSIVNLMALYAMVALGLNLLVGNTGQISLGHAGFVAIGAYAAVLGIRTGIPFPLALLGAAALSAFFGALLGLPSLRLEGPYLAIATLGFGLAVTVIIGRTALFGGRMGLTAPKLYLSWSGLPYDQMLYYLITGTTIALTIAMHSIVKSRLGRAFQAIRDSEVAAAAAGINLARYKTLSFSISACFAGIAGGFWALYLSFINPTIFSFILSIKLLAIIVIGGLGTVTGAILGAVVMALLDLQLENVLKVPVLGPLLEQFSASFMSVSGIANVSWVFTGLILALIIIFEPFGLFGIWMRIKIYWKTWPF